MRSNYDAIFWAGYLSEGVGDDISGHFQGIVIAAPSQDHHDIETNPEQVSFRTHLGGRGVSFALSQLIDSVYC